MALQASGAISMGDINTELGLSATAQISMNDAAVRTLLDVASGAIALSNAYSKSNTQYLRALVNYGQSNGRRVGGTSTTMDSSGNIYSVHYPTYSSGGSNYRVNVVKVNTSATVVYNYTTQVSAQAETNSSYYHLRHDGTNLIFAYPVSSSSRINVAKITPSTGAVSLVKTWVATNGGGRTYSGPGVTDLFVNSSGESHVLWTAYYPFGSGKSARNIYVAFASRLSSDGSTNTSAKLYDDILQNGNSFNGIWEKSGDWYFATGRGDYAKILRLNISSLNFVSTATGIRVSSLSAYSHAFTAGCYDSVNDVHYASGSCGSTGAILAQFDSDASNRNWFRLFSFSPKTGYNTSNTICVDSSGNVYFLTYSYIDSSNNKLYLVKVNSSGTIQWQRNFDVPYIIGQHKLSISGSTLIIAGNFNYPSQASAQYAQDYYITYPTDGSRSGLNLTVGNFTFSINVSNQSFTTVGAVTSGQGLSSASGDSVSMSSDSVSTSTSSSSNFVETQSV